VASAKAFIVFYCIVVVCVPAAELIHSYIVPHLFLSSLNRLEKWAMAVSRTSAGRLSSI
jgi:hypothetical protein